MGVTAFGPPPNLMRGGQSQRGTLPLTEEVNESRDRHAEARRGMIIVHSFLLYTTLLDMHGTTMPFHALEVPSRALILSEKLFYFLYYNYNYNSSKLRPWIILK